MAFVVAGITGLIPGWLATVGGVEFAVIVPLAIRGLVRSRTAGVVLRLGVAGVTVRGYDVVPWSDLAEVVVAPMRPGWFLGSKRYPVLAFVPRPGVELPDPPTYGRRRYTWGRATRIRRYGTSLLVMPHAMTATLEEIVDAAALLGGLPVTRQPVRGSVRVFLLMGLAAAAAGALAALVSRLPR
ncbi:hypothetical protein [uncultured Friedmanniella sp.]|uniref:hypothetical protein n=1 Tax=uncultured Friedmanniella sp. TaxID=335381 RepID=UPI0035CBFFA1